jgi:peptidoglycan/LPS O-acetylase OafA/YrhL
MDSDASGIAVTVPVARAGKRTLSEVIEGHDNNFTLIRVVLASAVIYFHSFGLTARAGHSDRVSAFLHPITDVGALAVILFFFLSGLFVTQSLHRSGNVPGFIAKRALRIWPGYFACILATALMSSLLAGDYSFGQYLRSDGFYRYITTNGLFDNTWFIEGVFTGRENSALNGSIHTLPMESKMYVVLALLGILGLISRPAIIVAGAVAAFLVMLLTPAVDILPFQFFKGAYSRPATALFLLGVATYGLSGVLRIEAWQGLILLALCVATSGTLHTAFFLVTAAWVVTYIGQTRFRLPRFRNDLSYGIYLYGWPATQIVSTLTAQKINPYLLSILALALSSVFAAVSWRYIEKPAIALGKSIGSGSLNRRGAAVVAVLLGLLALCLAMQRIAASGEFASVGRLEAAIVDFGPHSARAGAQFNAQPDGGSALWLRVDKRVPAGTELVVDGTRLPAMGEYPVVTSTLPAALLAVPGTRVLYLEHRTATHIERSAPVRLTVAP